MRVDRLRAKYEIDVKYTHFPLHPDTPVQGLTLEQLFAGRNIDIPAAKARMVGLMADEGLPYGDRTMTYNSRLAQELAKWAEKGSGREIRGAARYNNRRQSPLRGLIVTDKRRTNVAGG